MILKVSTREKNSYINPNALLTIANQGNLNFTSKQTHVAGRAKEVEMQ